MLVGLLFQMQTSVSDVFVNFGKSKARSLLDKQTFSWGKTWSKKAAKLSKLEMHVNVLFRNSLYFVPCLKLKYQAILVVKYAADYTYF